LLGHGWLLLLLRQGSCFEVANKRSATAKRADEVSALDLSGTAPGEEDGSQQVGGPHREPDRPVARE
jgi:hypothetical protein